MKNHRDFFVCTELELGMKIEILGVTYEVLEIHTPETYDERGLRNVARRAREHGMVADLICVRPRGNRLHNLRAHRPSASGPMIVTYCLQLLTADTAFLEAARMNFPRSTSTQEVN